MLQSRGDFKQADKMEKSLADEPEIETMKELGGDPIELKDGQETIFISIMIELSLKQGIMKWSKGAEAGAMKKMMKLHDLESLPTGHKEAN